jgi:hypothetical protein
MSLICVQVDSPTDARNPFPAEVRRARPPGSVLAYHGTGRASLDTILSQGFIARADASLLADVERVDTASEKFQFFGNIRSRPGIVAVAYAHRQLSESGGLARPFFSGSYAHARLYALRPGGEAAAGIVNFLDEFRQLVFDERTRELHTSQLRKRLGRLDKRAPGWSEIKVALERLDAEHLKDAWSELGPIRLRHAILKEVRHSPVVVAAWPAADTFLGAPSFLGPDSPALKPISPDRIFGVATLPQDSRPVDGGLEDYQFFVGERDRC